MGEPEIKTLIETDSGAVNRSHGTEKCREERGTQETQLSVGPEWVR